MCVIITMRGVNKKVEESNANIKNKKGKKKILIVIISIVLICLIVLFTLYKLSVFDDLIDDNNSEKFSLYPTENEISNAESLTYSPIRITCGNDETATPGFGYSIYEGENVYCTFSIMTYAKGTIDEIWFDYEYNEKFKYLNSRLINGKTQWDIDYSIKSDEVKISKNDKKINLIFNNDFSKNLYNFYVVEFKSYKVYKSNDEAFEEVERLKEIGYTYGFTKKEVEKQREKYERMLDNIIEEE